MVTEFERLVARVMSTAFIGTPTIIPKVKVKKQKKHRLTKRLANMSKEQKELLLLLISEKVAMITIKGETYAYRRIPDGWIIRSLYDGSPEHTVLTDFSACSCQDCHYRGKICKHILALREIHENSSIS